MITQIAKSLFYLLLLFVLTFQACKRVDEEPVAPTRTITRLYVSFSDVYQDDGIVEPYTNLRVIDPADSITEGMISGNVLGFNSQTTYGNGRGIVFDPNMARVIQVGSEDRSIRPFSVNTAGVISAATFFIDTLASRGIRDAALYSFIGSNNARVYQFFVADMTLGQIALYPTPQSLTNYVIATKRFALNGTPFGMDSSNDSLFVSMTGSSHEIRLYKDLGSLEAEGEATLITPAPLASITVSGASDLRGLAYSSILDYLVVADNNGRVHIIEDVRTKLEAGGSIAPSRTISGLANPSDVAIDDRPGKGKLYVADRGTFAIYLYDIATADGNASRLGQYTFPAGNARTPEFIYLDAR